MFTKSKLYCTRFLFSSKVLSLETTVWTDLTKLFTQVQLFHCDFVRQCIISKVFQDMWVNVPPVNEKEQTVFKGLW